MTTSDLTSRLIGEGDSTRRHVSSRWLIGLAAGQFAGYSLLWLLLHVPGITPPVNGWFGQGTGYGAWVARQPLVSWLASHPQVAGVSLLAVFAFVCLVFLAAVALAWRGDLRLSTKRIVVLTTLLAVPLLAAPQLLASDVYNYAMYGRIPVLYGGNPLIDIPADFPNDPLLPSVAWKTTASVYGPAWIMVSAPLTVFAEQLGGSAGMYVLLYQVLGLGCHLGSIVALTRLLERVRPSAVTWGTLAYSWHPLVLIEFVANGHNDSLMLLLVLLALLYATRQRPSLALSLLVVAGMVKLVAILLAPLYALYIVWQTIPARRLLVLVRQMLLGLALLVLLYLPFWDGLRTLQILVTAPPLTVLHQSPASWVATKLSAVTCVSAAPTNEQLLDARPSCVSQVEENVRRASLLVFAIIYGLLLCWPMRAFDHFIGRAVGVLIAYNLLAAVHFEPWYATWVLALAPLLLRPRPLLLIWGGSLLLLYGTMGVPGRILLAFAPLLMLGLDDLRRRISVGAPLLRARFQAASPRAVDET